MLNSLIYDQRGTCNWMKSQFCSSYSSIKILCKLFGIILFELFSIKILCELFGIFVGQSLLSGTAMTSLAFQHVSHDQQTERTRSKTPQEVHTRHALTPRSSQNINRNNHARLIFNKKTKTQQKLPSLFLSQFHRRSEPKVAWYLAEIAPPWQLKYTKWYACGLYSPRSILASSNRRASLTKTARDGLCTFGGGAILPVHKWTREEESPPFCEPIVNPRGGMTTVSVCADETLWRLSKGVMGKSSKEEIRRRSRWRRSTSDRTERPTQGFVFGKTQPKPKNQQSTECGRRVWDKIIFLLKTAFAIYPESLTGSRSIPPFGVRHCTPCLWWWLMESRNANYFLLLRYDLGYDT